MALVYTKRRYYKGKLVAYVKKNDGIVRYKLAKIPRSALTPTMQVKSSYSAVNPTLLNKEIDEIEKKVEDAIVKLLYSNPRLKLSNQVINDFLTKEENKDISPLANSLPQKMGKILVRDFQTFIDDKTREKREEDLKRGLDRKLHPTMKDYISSLHSLKDFETYTGRYYVYEDVNEPFISELIEFLQIDHSDLEDKDNGLVFLTKGNLANKSLNKRLQCISTFIRVFYQQEPTAERIASMIGRRQLDEHNSPEVIRITKKELEELADMPLDDSEEKRIRDFFVFLCLTGLRFSDFIHLKPNNIVQDTCNDRIYYKIVLYTQKTIKFAEIPLTKIAKAIIDKYNTDFNIYSNQVFNRSLKNFLKKHKLYEDNQIKHKFIGKKLIEMSLRRRELLSAHSGRRTFISILVEEGIAIERIMKMTGHTSERKLRVYIDRFSKKSLDDISPLDF